MTVLAAPLDRISAEAEPYPADMLQGCDTGLCLFSAAFGGRNDAIHFARYGLTTTCVDRDSARLEQMREVYPDDWTFLVSDAWDFAETCVAEDVWFDAVSVDTFLGVACDRSLESLDLWCSLARKCVTVTVPTGPSPPVPSGWRGYVYKRSWRASWLVMQR